MLSKSIKSYGLTKPIYGQNGQFGGGIFSPKSLRGTWTRFFSVQMLLVSYQEHMSPHFDQISENWMDGSKVIVRKLLFFTIFGHFGAFYPFWALRALTTFFENRRMSLFNLSKVTTSCKISHVVWTHYFIRQWVFFLTGSIHIWSMGSLSEYFISYCMTGNG